MSEIIVGRPKGTGDLVPKFRRSAQEWRASCRHCFRAHDVSPQTLVEGRCPWRPSEEPN